VSQFDTQLSGFRQVELRWGDTLQKLSLRELGDASRWVEIANLNGLRPPFVASVDSAASPNVAIYGASLIIPGANPTASATADPDLIYERDVKLINGKLTTSNGDFVVLSGVQNLIQSLTNRIATERRELLFHKEYGCDVRSIIGVVNGPVADLLAASYVRSAMREDPRVQDAPSATAIASGDVVRVDVEVITINNRRINFGGYF
jgi:phage baseplate assembly protein W